MLALLALSLFLCTELALAHPHPLDGPTRHQDPINLHRPVITHEPRRASQDLGDYNLKGSSTLDVLRQHWKKVLEQEKNSQPWGWKTSVDEEDRRPGLMDVVEEDGVMIPIQRFMDDQQALPTRTDRYPTTYKRVVPPPKDESLPWILTIGTIPNSFPTGVPPAPKPTKIEKRDVSGNQRESIYEQEFEVQWGLNELPPILKEASSASVYPPMRTVTVDPTIWYPLRSNSIEQTPNYEDGINDCQSQPAESAVNPNTNGDIACIVASGAAFNSGLLSPTAVVTAVPGRIISVWSNDVLRRVAVLIPLVLGICLALAIFIFLCLKGHRVSKTRKTDTEDAESDTSSSGESSDEPSDREKKCSRHHHTRSRHGSSRHHSHHHRYPAAFDGQDDGTPSYNMTVPDIWDRSEHLEAQNNPHQNNPKINMKKYLPVGIRKWFSRGGSAQPPNAFSEDFSTPMPNQIEEPCSDSQGSNPPPTDSLSPPPRQLPRPWNTTYVLREAANRLSMLSGSGSYGSRSLGPPPKRSRPQLSALRDVTHLASGNAFTDGKTDDRESLRSRRKGLRDRWLNELPHRHNVIEHGEQFDDVDIGNHPNLNPFAGNHLPALGTMALAPSVTSRNEPSRKPSGRLRAQDMGDISSKLPFKEPISGCSPRHLPTIEHVGPNHHSATGTIISNPVKERDDDNSGRSSTNGFHRSVEDLDNTSSGNNTTVSGSTVKDQSSVTNMPGTFPRKSSEQVPRPKISHRRSSSAHGVVNIFGAQKAQNELNGSHGEVIPRPANLDSGAYSPNGTRTDKKVRYSGFQHHDAIPEHPWTAEARRSHSSLAISDAREEVQAF